MYSANQIGAYILQKCIEDSMPINVHQLSHIMYLIAEETVRETPIFNAIFELGGFGPICLDVYYDYYPYGMMPINQVEHRILLNLPPEKSIPEVDKIILKYRGNSLKQLVEKVNTEGGFYPYMKKMNQEDPTQNSSFDVFAVKKFYTNKKKRA